MPGNDPALLRMPDIEFLGIIRVMCKTLDNKTTQGKFEAQTRHVAESKLQNKMGPTGKAQVR